MESITYNAWNICNAYNEQGIEYWTVWTPDLTDVVAEDFKTVDHAKKWIDDYLKEEKVF